MLKFFSPFKRMILPACIVIFFWIASAVAVGLGIYGILHHDALTGILVMTLGPLALRCFCEYCMVVFRIDQTLLDIKALLQGKTDL